MRRTPALFQKRTAIADYPLDQQHAAVDLVLEQAEPLAPAWPA